MTQTPQEKESESETFRQQVYQVMEDSRLYVFLKAVMIAKLLYKGNPGRVQEVLNQPDTAMRFADRELVRFGWLASPESEQS